MATNRSLLFNIVARYQGDRAMQGAADSLDRFGRAAGKLIAVAPAAQAASAGIVAGVGAATATFAAAGAALGAFGAAVAPQIKKMNETSDASLKLAKARETAANKQQVADRLEAQGSALAGKAQTAATSAKLAAVQAENAYRRATKGLPTETRDAAMSFAKLKLAYQGWSNSLTPTTMPMFTKGFNTVRKMLPSLTPLVRTAGAALDNFFNSAADGVNNGGFAKFMTRLNEAAKVSLPNLLLSIKNIFVGVGGVIKAFLPSTAGFSDGIENMTRKFAAWGQGLSKSEGFKNFMSYVRENGPLLMEVLGNVGRSVVSLIAALGPLTGQSLVLVNAFASIIAATPVPVLTILARFLTLAYIATKIYTAQQIVSNTVSIVWAALQRRGGLAVIFHYTALRVLAVATRAWAIATTVAAVATRLLGAAMRATPVGVLITLFAVLVAGIVWVATKTRFFQTVWAGAVKGIVAAVHWVAAAFKWLWNFLFGHSVIPDIVAAFKAAWLVLQTITLWLLNSVIKPIWRAIGAAIRVVVYAVKLYISAWILVFRLVAAAGRIMASALVAAFKRFYNGVLAVWGWVRKNVVNPMRTYFTVLVPAAAAKLRSAVVGSFLALYNRWRGIWGGFKSNILNPIRNFFTKTIPGAASTLKSKLINAFQEMVKGIKTAWSKLSAVVKKPVKFFIETVYNNGLRAAWNSTAGKIPGVPDLPKASLPKGFAQGGPIRGKGGPTADKVPIMASPGEYMIRAKRVRELGVRTLDRINGGGKKYPEKHIGGKHAGGSGFAMGGLIPDAVKNVAGKVWDAAGNGFDWAKNFTRDIAGKALRGLFKPFQSMVSGITSKYPDSGIMGTAVKQFVTSGFDKMMSFAESLARDDVDPSVAGALKFAKAQAGKPYVWGGVGPGGYDCSGFMSAIQNVIENKKPHHRRWATGAFSGNRAPSGWKRHLESGFKVGITNKGVGHTAGTLGGVKVESRGGDGVVVGNRARGHKAGLFGSSWYGLKAATGGSGGGSGQWSQTVTSVLQELGIFSQGNLSNVLKAIQKESGGNPKAINKWDSNAKAGHASRGLLQTIPGTFNAYAGRYKSLGITNPYANIYAAVRYARSRYGKGWAARMARPGGYAEGGLIPSFDTGGTLAPGINTVYNGTGSPEPLTRADAGSGGDTYVFNFKDKVYAKTEREFEDLLVGALREVKRKGRSI